MIKNYIRFAVLSLFAVWLTACSKDDTDDDQPPQEVTRWECILFGSYPANEVVSGNFNAVEDYAKRHRLHAFIPKRSFTTDNAAMIAVAGYFKYLDGDVCDIAAPPFSRVTV